MLNETQALELASSPEKIIDPSDCTVIIGFLNGTITDLENLGWEKQLVANQHKVTLLNEPENTNAKAEALWKISTEYQEWQAVVRTIRKFKAFRNALKSRHDDLAGTRPYIRNQ